MDSLRFLRICGFFWIITVLGVSAQSDGDVRLEAGPSSLQGRLEVYYSGEWGTVCNNGWSSTDSDVICRQLGYQVSLPVVAPSSITAAMNTQRIWLTNVQCETTDATLQDCSPQWGTNTGQCTHSSDVNVNCTGINMAVSPNYKGCYEFNSGGPLTEITIQIDANTVENCLSACSSAHAYAAMYGVHCLCGSTITAGSQVVDNSFCTTPCPGNSEQICGTDQSHVSLYSVALANGTLASPWFPGNYVTLFSDTSQETTVTSTASDISTDSGSLLLRFSALGLASTDTLTVQVAGATPSEYTYDSTSGPTTLLLTGLPATTTVTATLTQAANSPGGSGYLIVPESVSCELPTTIENGAVTSPSSGVTWFSVGQTVDVTCFYDATTPGRTLTCQAGGPWTWLPNRVCPPFVSTTPPTTTPTTQPKTTTMTTTTPAPTTTPTTMMPRRSTVPITTARRTTTRPTTIAPTPTPATPCTHPVVQNGTILTDPLSRDYRVGETVILSCEAGFTPSENTILTCQADGTWNPPPACSSPSSGVTLETWLIIVIAIASLVILICLICIIMVCIITFNRDEKDDERPTITHLGAPGDNDYTGRPPLIPITEAAAAGVIGAGIARPPALDESRRSPLANDAVQQTEPLRDRTPPQSDPPTPTENYPPRDYPGSVINGGRDSMLVNGIAGTHQMNGHANGHNMGKEERQAVDALFNAVREYDDTPSPSAGLYGSVPPRHLRTGSAVSGSVISVISNPGRTTDVPTSPRYSAGSSLYRSVQFDGDGPNFKP